MDLSVLFQVSYGLYVIGANDSGQPTGCIANTFTQVTNEDNRVSVCLNKSSYTLETIRRTGKFSVSILSEQTNPVVISVFGFQSGKQAEKFRGFSYSMRQELPVLEEHCCGALLCDVIEEVDMGTHVVVFAKLADTVPGESVAPMTYDYYHKVVKGKAPKTAPTYVAEQPEKKDQVRFVCSVCGYVYEGDLEQEPDDFKCPVCGAGKEKFYRS